MQKNHRPIRRIERTGRRDKGSGSSIIELVLGLSAMVPLLLYSLDLLLLLLSLTMTSSLVNAACRLAANGQPANFASVHAHVPVSKYEGPYKRAEAALKTVDSSIIEIDPQLNVSESISAPLPSLPRGGNVHGAVCVKMTAFVHLPVPLPGVGDKLQLPLEQTLPYTWSLAPAPAPEDEGFSEDDSDAESDESA